MIAVRIVDEAGRSPNEAVQSRLHKILERVRQSGKLIQDGLLWTVRNHFTTIYPDSKHYSPDKVQPDEMHNGMSPSASITVDVPGVTRAYHDMLIRPRFRKYLSIPIHRESYGKQPRQFDGLIFIKKKNGNKLLAQKLGTGLVFLYALKEQVFQKQDSRLMPSDEVLAQNIFSRVKAYLSMAR